MDDRADLLVFSRVVHELLAVLFDHVLQLLQVGRGFFLLLLVISQGLTWVVCFE